MAFTKERKSELLAQYTKQLKDSQAVFVVGFKGMSMKDVDMLRAKAREIGNELHVVKNTIFKRALEAAELPKMDYIDGASLVGFTYHEAPAMAKILTDAAKGSEVFSIKGGFLGAQTLAAAQVKALAELPTLPVMRARLLGLLQTPATQFVRTLAEPARRLAYVVKAHSEQPVAA